MKGAGDMMLKRIFPENMCVRWGARGEISECRVIAGSTYEEKVGRVTQGSVDGSLRSARAVG